MVARKKRKNNIVIYIILAFLSIYFCFVTIRSLKESLLLNARDRINIIFYGKESMLISLGISDNVNYIITFDNNDRVTVPGGYGRYAIGALGRLTEVEQDKKIIQKSFSSMISGYADFYVVPKKNSIYTVEDQENEPEYVRRKLISRIFSQHEFNNIRFLDKILAAFLIGRKRQQDFIFLKTFSSESDDGGGPLYSEKNFLKKYKGFFYHQSLREEGEDIKIAYTTYKSAVILSRIIEGQGIRVVDLTQNIEKPRENCTLLFDSTKQSKTIHYLSQRFGCSIQKNSVEGADIIMILGDNLEKNWE